MDLILWRHADAGDPLETGDLTRPLTAKGERQAARMAKWLERQLPDHARVISSPAKRAVQTAQSLGRKFKLRAELAPDASTLDLLEVVQWPQGKGVCLVVGHQPVLGQVAAQLLGVGEDSISVRKGSVWWFRRRERRISVPAGDVAVAPGVDSAPIWEAVLLCSQNPEML